MKTGDSSPLMGGRLRQAGRELPVSQKSAGRTPEIDAMTFSALHWISGYKTAIGRFGLQHRKRMSPLERLRQEPISFAAAEYRRYGMASR
ncbi:hypothetical protein [Sulfuritalea sp.]|uniref:hypothetical protein n=1 Tax=Sulfuritalea sp. TaxID=2480090 RepID=UPI001AC38658|nr:hypothetical protein [Sulfuritalea sp.]MBN8473763.1 hypothetical protein [Sulfuritalea sp.]